MLQWNNTQLQHFEEGFAFSVQIPWELFSPALKFLLYDIEDHCVPDLYNEFFYSLVQSASLKLITIQKMFWSNKKVFFMPTKLEASPIFFF